ncbi:MAG: gliding motility-associated C-terminal domain-containing protein [Bacteroidetes bacterium]|nr:gliding motility-associated C-terminal domain-containing protein [Bacteroidota bacterium]
MKFSNPIFTKGFFGLVVFSLLFTLESFAQVTISSQLVGASGNYSSGGGVLLSSSVGEMTVNTFFSGSHYLTQGFQQPNSDALSFTTNSLNSSCFDADNGYAEVAVKSGVGPFQYQWLPTAENTASIKNLKPGSYTVTVTDARGFSLTDTVTVLLDYEGACGLHIYSGITPNGDNHNDTWVIDGINEFPSNHVFLFNRWGDKVWEKNNYNNTDVVWDGTNMKNERLPDGTYFYIVSIDSKKYKGWVELTH